jgi:hypothetical protein
MMGGPTARILTLVLTLGLSPSPADHVETLHRAHYNGHLGRRRRGRIRGVSPVEEGARSRRA